MNNNGELKAEFQEFIEDLVKDIIKSVLYEDFKDLYNKYYKNESDLEKIVERVNYSDKQIKTTIDRLDKSSQNIHTSAVYLAQTIDALTEKVREEVNEDVRQLLNENKRTTDNLYKKVSITVNEVLESNHKTENKINMRLQNTEHALNVIDNNVMVRSNQTEQYLRNQINELREFSKKTSIAAIALGVINLLILVRMLLGVM